MQFHLRIGFAELTRRLRGLLLLNSRIILNLAHTVLARVLVKLRRLAVIRKLFIDIFVQFKGELMRIETGFDYVAVVDQD